MDVLGRHLSNPSYHTSVSQQGEVLLKDQGGRLITIYKYQATTGTFTKLRQLNGPRGVRIISAQVRCYSQDGTVVLQAYVNSATIVISSEGEQLRGWRQPGILIGCWANKRRVYENLNRMGSEVCIVDENNTQSYLRPSPGHIWSRGWISACEDEVTDYKAVCHAPINDESQHTLEIYNSECKLHNIKIVCIIKYCMVNVEQWVRHLIPLMLRMLVDIPFT